MAKNHNQHTLKKGITIVSFLLIAFVAGCGFFDDLCATQLHDTIPSPNGELKAVVYQRDCGATTSFMTNISIMESDEPLQNGVGNIYRRRGHPIRFAPLLYWQSDAELVIVEGASDNSYENAQSWESSRSKVTISYRDSLPQGSTITRPTPILTPAAPTGPLPLLPTPSSSYSDSLPPGSTITPPTPIQILSTPSSTPPGQ